MGLEAKNLRMKMTIEIDERTLSRVMKLTGIKTKKDAADFTLSAAERSVRRDKLLSTSIDPKDRENAVDPKYDVGERREREKPGI